MAAVTRRIGLQTGVLLLPLRDTVITAKQAAEVDVLSGGRLRLGVGVGHMAFEFVALGRSFEKRGRRLDEQMVLLRALWTRESVSFDGREHHIDGAGLNPLPVQRPIPLWVAGGVRASVRRAAQLGDGWILPGTYVGQPPDDSARQLRDWLREEEAATGRPQGSVGIQGVSTIIRTSEADWAAHGQAWEQFGATDLLIDTGTTPSDTRLNTIQSQLQALRRVKEVLDPVLGNGR